MTEQETYSVTGWEFAVYKIELILDYFIFLGYVWVVQLRFLLSVRLVLDQLQLGTQWTRNTSYFRELLLPF